jgi:hypothetical protein
VSSVDSSIVPDGSVRSLSEAEMADVWHQSGAWVASRQGRYWATIQPGFYQPVNLVATFTRAELTRPSPRCWGYRAALDPADARSANGSVPVHYAPLAGHVDPSAMSHGRVQDLRKCRASVEIRLCRDPDVFEAHGARVYQSAQERLHYWKDLDEPAYRKMIRQLVADPRRIFVGGFVDGVLAGYLESYIVGRVIYARELIVASDVLKTGISTGLYVDTMELGLRAGAIDAACLGLDTPERKGLTSFKTSLGFPVVHLPAISHIPAPLAAVIRARRPWSYYRLVGTAPAAALAGAS